MSLHGLRCSIRGRKCQWSAILSLIQQKSLIGVDTPATEGGEDRSLDETQLIGKHFGRRIDPGGKYPLCFTAVDNAELHFLWKVTSPNDSRAKVSKLATWARLEPINYQYLLHTPKPLINWKAMTLFIGKYS